jgi:hypothetical protein
VGGGAGSLAGRPELRESDSYSVGFYRGWCRALGPFGGQTGIVFETRNLDHSIRLTIERSRNLKNWQVIAEKEGLSSWSGRVLESMNPSETGMRHFLPLDQTEFFEAYRLSAERR